MSPVLKKRDGEDQCTRNSSEHFFSETCSPRIGWDHYLDCDHLAEVRAVISLETILTSQPPDSSLAGWNLPSEFLNMGTENSSERCQKVLRLSVTMSPPYGGSWFAEGVSYEAIMQKNK